MREKARLLKRKLAGVFPFLNEKQRRVLAAAEAKSYGWGGVRTVAQITGMSRNTIYRGLDDLQIKGNLGRIREAGGGRKKLSEQNPEFISAIEELIEPATRGDPESPLRWTCKSVRNIAEGLEEQGYAVSHQTVANILHGLEYSVSTTPGLVARGSG